MASEAVSKKGVILVPFLDRIFHDFPEGPRATSGHDCEAKNDPNTIRPNTRHDCEAGSKMLHFGSHFGRTILRLSRHRYTKVTTKMVSKGVKRCLQRAGACRRVPFDIFCCPIFDHFCETVS